MMNALFWLLIGGASVATLSYVIKSHRIRSLPRISDREFVRLYKEEFAGPDELVLEQRRAIATHLGLPPASLSPGDTFKQLSSYTGFVGEYEVGMGDMEAELLELFERASLTPQSFPLTIGALIQESLKAKQRIPPAG